jgi:hypothetical protein
MSGMPLGTPSLAGIVEVLMDVQSRVTRLESTASTQLGQGREHIELLTSVKLALADRDSLERRLWEATAQRNAMFELVGRMRVASRLASDLPEDRAHFVADLAAALKEMGAH